MINIVFNNGPTYYDVENKSKEEFIEILSLLNDEVMRLTNVDTSDFGMDQHFEHLSELQHLQHQLALLEVTRERKYPIKPFVLH